MNVDPESQIINTKLSTDQVTATFGIVAVLRPKSPGAHYTFRYPVQARDVIEAVSFASGVCVEDLIGPRRSRMIARPRQLAMFICRERCHHLSLPGIGRCLGNRDHSTILHGARNIEHLLTIDNNLLFEYHQAMKGLIARDAKKAATK